MNIGNGLIQATGDDCYGSYVMSGNIEGKIAKIKKEYIGVRDLQYIGKVITPVLIRGTYQGENGICMFSLEKCKLEEFEKDFQNIT